MVSYKEWNISELLSPAFLCIRHKAASVQFEKNIFSAEHFVPLVQHFDEMFKSLSLYCVQRHHVFCYTKGSCFCFIAIGFASLLILLVGRNSEKWWLIDCFGCAAASLVTGEPVLATALESTLWRTGRCSHFHFQITRVVFFQMIKTICSVPGFGGQHSPTYVAYLLNSLNVTFEIPKPTPIYWRWVTFLLNDNDLIFRG